MKNFRGLLFLVLALATSCSSQSSSESGVETTNVALPGSIDNDDGSGATLADSNWADTREIELELAWGGNISIQVSIGAVTTLTNPDSQIDSVCALSDLPPVGTSFQRIEVTVKSNSSRDIAYPKVSLGSLGRTENSIFPEEFFSMTGLDGTAGPFGGLPPNLGCVLKEDKDILYGASGNDFAQEFMGPGDVESFQTILTVKPGAPAYWQWALLVTNREDEIDFTGVLNPDGLSSKAFLIGLHDFGSEVLPDLEPGSTDANLINQICVVLTNLKFSEEAPDSQNLKTLSRGWELNDSELSSLVNQVIDDYEAFPDMDDPTFSLVFARNRCRDLGN